MDASLRFGHWYTLDAMDAAFEFELAISVVTTNLEDDFFHATGLVFAAAHELKF